MTRPRLRATLGALILVAMAASALYGGDFFGLRERFPPPASRTKATPFGPAIDQAPATATASVRRSQPYWRALTRFEGTGPLTTPTFAVDSRALQWRVKWRCQRGAFQIQPQRPSSQERERRLAQTDNCPARGTGISVAPGEFRLDVQAQGKWQAQIEQQVDVPLIQAPTPAMRSPRARVAASGSFYDIDEDGEGSVKIYRQPDGSASLRLEDFYVTPNVDLEIRLSELAHPQTTEEVDRAAFEDVVFLKATSGSMNYRLPPGTLNSRVRSVVIWCELTENAYAAASLQG